MSDVRTRRGRLNWRNLITRRLRVRQAREHEMQDVVDEVVLARGDEDLGPSNAIGAVSGWNSLAANT